MGLRGMYFRGHYVLRKCLDHVRLHLSILFSLQLINLIL